MQNRSRTCINPPPAFGGKSCPGESDETRACNEDPCPSNSSDIHFVVAFLGKFISSLLSLGRVSYLLSSFQLMVIGLTGRTGATVPSRVVAECKIGPELVLIPRRLLVESRVLERVTKPERATKILAQVKCLLSHDFCTV